MGKNRREFFRLSLGGAGAWALRSLATGLPLSFLRMGQVVEAQQARAPTFLVLAVNGSGDPINANCFGSYPNPSDKNDVRRQIAHATVAELGTNPYGTVGGVPYGAADFATGFECRLGTTTCWAARPWAQLPDALRQRMAVIRHRTYTNAHPEYPNVMRFHGAVKGPGRIGVEALPSFIAQETAAGLGTTLEVPMCVGGGGITFRGAPVRTQSPDQLQSIFSASGEWAGLSPSAFASARDQTLDSIYRSLHESGTHAQRRFVDAHARTRAEARKLSETLSSALEPIAATDDLVHKQVLAAAALFEHNVTPAVLINLPFGGDNHQDANLEVEVTETLQGIEGIRLLWEELNARGLKDRVTFAHLGVFGRTLKRSSGGGRSHYGNDHTMVMFGPNVKGGLYGQLDQELQAGPIDDVAVDETLSAAGKTLARATGIGDTIIDQRIVGGRALF